MTYGYYRTSCPRGCGKTVSVRIDSGRTPRHQCFGYVPKKRRERIQDWWCRRHGEVFNSPKAKPCRKGPEECVVEDYKAVRGRIEQFPACRITTHGSLLTCSTHDFQARFLKVPPTVCPRPRRKPEWQEGIW